MLCLKPKQPIFTLSDNHWSGSKRVYETDVKAVKLPGILITGNKLMTWKQG